MSDIKAPKYIWIDTDESFYYVDIYKRDDDIKYIRADRYTALLDAAVSLHHWLFEMKKKFVPFISADVLTQEDYNDIMESAQLALDKWNRFCDGKDE